MIRATPILPGTAAGPLFRLAEPLSFWGGVDPKTGRIIDPGCAAVGRSVAGTILAMPATRGSSSGSAVMLELLHAGLAPAALILGEIDAIIGLGILVAREMAWPTIPLLLLPVADQRLLPDHLTIDRDGSIGTASDEGALSPQAGAD